MSLLERCLKDPEWFLRNVLLTNPWRAQRDIIDSVRDYRRTIVSGCIASSKTCAAGMATLWWLSSHYPARVFTIAPTYRQVQVNIWGEIRRMYNGARASLGGKMLPESPELKIADGWYAMGFATDRPDYVHGIHGANDLMIVDEAQGIDQPMFDAIENMMAGGNARLLMLCNPNVLSGEVYEAFHSKRHLYNCMKISAWDTPNVKEGREVIPGMITRTQVEEWIKTYGRDSNFVRVKVDADFPTQEADTLIPIDWIEKATVRQVPEGVPVLGVDVARFGDDLTVIQPMLGRKGLPQIVIRKQDTMEVAGSVAMILKQTASTVADIDEIGIGSGVIDRLRELAKTDARIKAKGVNVAEKAKDEDRFANLRSEMWWTLRDALDPMNPANISIPKDAELMAELSSVKFKVNSNGKVQIEPKEEMKKRLGRSPDRADALCLAVHATSAGARPVAALSQGNPFAVARPAWA